MCNLSRHSVSEYSVVTSIHGFSCIQYEVTFRTKIIFKKMKANQFFLCRVSFLKHRYIDHYVTAINNFYFIYFRMFI